MAEEVLRPIDYVSPLTWIVWLLSLPVRVFAYLTARRKAYNPEKIMCPCCGFKGDSGTLGRSCDIMCVDTGDKVRGVMLRHICLRCSAKYWTAPLVDPQKWYR